MLIQSATETLERLTGRNSELLSNQISLFLEASECIDDIVDRIHLEVLRKKMIDSISQYLITGNVQFLCFDELKEKSRLEEMKRHLIALRASLHDVSIFCDTLEKFWQANVIMHTTNEVRTFIQARMEEANYFGEMMAHAIQEETRKDIIYHLQLFVRIFNGLDSIVDAKSDYKEGEIQFKPNISFYLEMAMELFPELLKLFLITPKRKLLRDCMKYTPVLLRKLKGSISPIS